MSDDAPTGLEAHRLLAVRRRHPDRPVLHVASDEARAEAVAGFLAAAEPGLRVVEFPAGDRLPGDPAPPSPEIMGRRLRILREIADAPAPRPLVITTPAAVLQRVPPASEIPSLAVRAGEEIELEAFRTFCMDAGYIADDRVDEAGEIAFRGEVIDIFPGGHLEPYRLELLDGRIASIRCYDPVTQLSRAEMSALEIVGVSEFAEPPEGPRSARAGPGSAPASMLLDHLPGAVLVLSAPGIVDRALRQLAEALDGGVLDGAGKVKDGGLFLSADEWERVRQQASAVVLDLGGWRPAPAIAAAGRPRRALAEFVGGEIRDGRNVLLVAPDEAAGERLARRVGDVAEREVVRSPGLSDATRDGDPGIRSLVAPLDHGFVDERQALAVLTVEDVFGSRAAVAVRGDNLVRRRREAVGEFHLGDLVVHEARGIGRLDGLEATAEDDGELIRLVYAREQRLLVPASEAGLVWRYGSAEGDVTLDRLDAGGWEGRRRKVEAALGDLARRLVEAAAERERADAPRLSASGAAYERFVARFPYSETADQRRAVAEVLADVGSGRRMDRLVVGDVGFGKTEVALRAAAAAAFSGLQVAVVAPTTILARQHAEVFARRFAGLGVEVGLLSRLVPAAEARTLRERLADGRLRVVVGTHALLGKGVAFANLGLVVVDEEQRFGAAHKRRLSNLAGAVHRLVLTATPIPRTLQAALVGLQDLSILATPPARRRPVRTLPAEWDDALVRRALLRERRRGGQSFVVVPRIEDVEPIVARIRAAAPELSLLVAHGKLPAARVDDAMMTFAGGRADVLVATSIIESGLDVPCANTMLVVRPDLFGLAQLHQLRGRVGRGSRQAYCMLVGENGAELGEAALRRLGTLQTFDRLGAGLEISAADLDQRGAGDLVGDRQAGHVATLGAELYQELLVSALRQARGAPADPHSVELRSDVRGMLPASYIPEPELRIGVHHRLARLTEPVEVERFADEIADRFGPLPEPAGVLLSLAHLRATAGRLGLDELKAGPDGIAVRYRGGLPDPADLAAARARFGDDLQCKDDSLLLRRRTGDAAERLGLARQLLDLLR